MTCWRDVPFTIGVLAYLSVVLYALVSVVVMARKRMARWEREQQARFYTATDDGGRVERQRRQRPSLQEKLDRLVELAKKMKKEKKVTFIVGDRVEAVCVTGPLSALHVGWQGTVIRADRPDDMKMLVSSMNDVNAGMWADISAFKLLEKAPKVNPRLFKLGSFVQRKKLLKGAHDNVMMVRRRQDGEASQYPEYFRGDRLLQSPDSLGELRYMGDYIPLELPHDPEPELAEAVKEGSDIILRGGELLGAIDDQKGSAVQFIEEKNGERWFRVFVEDFGYGVIPARFLKVNPASLVPDATGHVHAWQMRWNGTYRFCECGLKQWSLACWTGTRWDKQAPESQTESHRTLDFDKTRTLPRPSWTTAPHRTRSYDLIPDEALTCQVHVIGAGAIGSFTVLNLVKMGISDIHVWDHDVVSPENIGTQLYGRAHLVDGSDTRVIKVEALADIVRLLGPGEEHYKLTTHHQKFDASCLPPRVSGRHNEWPGYLNSHRNIFILAVDSMAARTEIFRSIIKFYESWQHWPHTWLIDARMGAENALMYTMDLRKFKDRESYGKTLYTDAKALREPCTAQGTIYTASLISGMVCKAVKDLITNNLKYPRVVHWDIANNHQIVHHAKGVDSVPTEASAIAELRAGLIDFNGMPTLMNVYNQTPTNEAQLGPLVIPRASDLDALRYEVRALAHDQLVEAQADQQRIQQEVASTYQWYVNGLRIGGSLNEIPNNRPAGFSPDESTSTV